MALYRTKPEEVEAIQYTGSMTAPFENTVPAWVWGALSTGTLKFMGHGIEISYNGLTEVVAAGDWLVLPDDGIIRAAEDKVFRQYYTPARKRSTQAKEEVTKAVTPVETVAAPAVVQPEAEAVNPADAFPSQEPTDEFDAAFDAIAAKVGQTTVAAE